MSDRASEPGRRESRSADPQREACYRAEHEALSGSGRAFSRFSDVEAWVESVVSAPAWLDGFPDAPVEVRVQRRSRSARYAAAERRTATIWIPAGSWTSPVVVHELAHLAVDVDDHGPLFAGALLTLVRRFVGFDAYGALSAAFDRRGVDYDQVS